MTMSDCHTSHRPADSRLAALRARIRTIEGTAGGWMAGAADGARAPTISLTAAVDRALPWGGLPRGALHEVIAGAAGAASATGATGAAGAAGAAAGFAALVLARLAQADTQGMVLWCGRPRILDIGAPYPPGLSAFGLDPRRVILVYPRREADVLWALEEGLRAPALAAVLGEVDAISLTASRRLQLAAEASGVTALLVRPRSAQPGASAALTRWRIGTAPTAAPGTRRWRATLFRCRGGTPGDWTMEVQDETGDLVVAAPVRDRPAVPRPARLAG